jgi:hypothetical protein
MEGGREREKAMIGPGTVHHEAQLMLLVLGRRHQ